MPPMMGTDPTVAMLAIMQQMVLQQSQHMRDQHESADRRTEDLGRILLQMREKDDASKAERAEKMHIPLKLRTEGMPMWPPYNRNAVYPFCIFAEDFSAKIALLGLQHVLSEPGKETEKISEAQDALTLRYIVAVITDNTISTHLASTYKSGQQAWQYLNQAFGLPSLGQSILRKNIEDLRVIESDDPRIVIMMMERLAARLDPPMQPKELSEQLMNKLPRAWKHVAAVIRGSLHGDMTNFAGPGGVKEMFIDIVKEEKRVNMQQSMRGTPRSG